MFEFKPTHKLNELRQEDIDTQVILSGWVHRRRDHGGLIFVDLRDRFGLTQLVFDPEKFLEAHQTAEKLRSEWVITVKGTVTRRAEGMENPNLETGMIEVLIHELTILSKAKNPPFSICDETIEVNEELRLKYRYLDIRRGDITKKLIARHQVMQVTRHFLSDEGFLEISTPILGKSTPEGARDYLVPARVYSGNFYALPQSPQIFKQLLMVAGIDRYFQIATCFRDEDLRADRQPEFTQIDLEISFGKPEELMSIIEKLLEKVFKEVINVNLKTPFPRISYSECLTKYGTDKPDTRFGMVLHDLTDIAKLSSFSVFLDQLQTGGVVKGLCVKGGGDLSRRLIDEYTHLVGRLGVKGLAWMKMQEGMLTSNIVKFFPEEAQQTLIERLGVEEGDLIFMISDEKDRTHTALDQLRRQLAKDRNLIQQNQWNFLWVTGFPLFEWDEEEKRLSSVHHPFTSPDFEDIELLDSSPLQVRALAYDLVLNGYEIGGGSQRIHDSDLQNKIFNLLKLSPEELRLKFGFFIDALSYGTPPHLGLALGLDRIMMLLTGTENIRDVIAFPKTQKASDLMMNAPSQVTAKQLQELKISIEESEFHWT